MSDDASLPEAWDAKAEAPSLVARLGLAIAYPAWALVVGGDRRRAGGSGTDLLLALGAFLLASQLRWLVSASWLAGIDAGLAVRAFVSVLTDAVTTDLAFLVVGALLLFAASGKRRDLGRAFDLACVAALPLLFVDLLASVLTFAAHVQLRSWAAWGLTGIAYGWTGMLLARAIGPARTATTRAISVPADVVTRARRVGWIVVAVAALGVGTQARWISANLEDVRPLESGGPAPAFTLFEIDAQGAQHERRTLASYAGKPLVLDFWATWCGPCLQSLPKLDAFARAHPEVSVVAVNLDDPLRARTLFLEHGYTPILLLGDEDVQRSYHVDTIPHTVVVDGLGQVRKVGHAGDMDLEGTIAALAK